MKGEREKMSELKVEIVNIDEILEHDNADRLEICKVFGWYVVVQKGMYKVGDATIYVPIDSILSKKLEGYLFPPDSKITLINSRVKSIKIRSVLSQGMLVSLEPGLFSLFPELDHKGVGDDVSEILEVTKYEPPLPSYQVQGRKGSYKNHPDLAKYTDIDNWKHYPNVFQVGEVISVTEKLHGTSVRYGRYPRSFVGMNRIRKFFSKLMNKSKDEFVYGSRNIQLQKGGRIYYGDDIYAKEAKKLGIDKLLEVGEALYGEIVGPSIQKGYDYGYKEDCAFFAYDVKVGDVYLSPPEFRKWCEERNIPMVPVMYEGAFDGDVEVWREGPSVIAPKAQPVREGVVIKPVVEGNHPKIGRKVLKVVSDKYLLKNQSDFH